MKKNIITSIISAAVAISTSSAFAADNEPILISAAPTAENEITVVAPTPTANDEPIVGIQQITVDGDKVDLSKTNLSQYIFEDKGNIMVPLRAVAEKMGYTVDWNADENSVTVGNDAWEAVIQIGTDNYFGVTKIKDAVGMTAPQSYGTAPQNIEATTFVPAKMFELMGYEYNSIGQYVNFEKIGTDNAAQAPNPFVSYDSVDDVKEVLSFVPRLPEYIPEEFTLDDISAIGNDFLQLMYIDKNNDRLSYRTAKGNDDISGDYNTYTINKEVKINDLTVILHGNDKITSAVWNDGNYSFAVYSDKELDESVMIKLIKGIK